jgi:hypothetical protein
MNAGKYLLSQGILRLNWFKGMSKSNRVFETRFCPYAKAVETAGKLRFAALPTVQTVGCICAKSKYPVIFAHPLKVLHNS